MRTAALAVFGVAILGVAASADALPAQSEDFRRGNALYEQGDYEGAAAAYSAVLAAGFESAALYFNLGNARYRLGQLGPAVLNYERAIRIEPGNDDVRANLALVNGQLADRIEPLARFWLLQAFDRWLALWPRGAVERAAASCWLLFGAALSLRILGRPRRGGRTLRGIAWATGAATIALVGTLAAKQGGWGRPEEAVVMVHEVHAVSAPSDDGLTLFAIHEGTKVRIDRRSGDWVEIVLADGRVGWMEAGVLEAI